MASFSALKTYDPPVHALQGAAIRGVARRGKFLDIDAGTGEAPLHLVFHLAKAGWLRWYDALPATLIRPGKTPIALRVALSDGSGFDLTEAGTKKSLAVYVVRDPGRGAGRRAARAGSARSRFHARRLRRPADRSPHADQGRAARSGDDRRHRQRVLRRDPARGPHVAVRPGGEPLARTTSRTSTRAMQETLTDAVAEASGKPPADLKDAKRRGMRVHGRAGQTCPVCGDTVRSVFFADNSLEYCPTCQTGRQAARRPPAVAAAEVGARTAVRPRSLGR